MSLEITDNGSSVSVKFEREITVNKTRYGEDEVVIATRTPVQLYVDADQLDYLENFVYLWVRISFDQNFMLEINRRILSAWRGVVSEQEIALKARIYTMCVTASLLFGSVMEYYEEN